MSRLFLWPGEDRSARALAKLDDDQLSDLSEAGQQLYRKARQERAEWGARNDEKSGRAPLRKN